MNGRLIPPSKPRKQIPCFVYWGHLFPGLVWRPRVLLNSSTWDDPLMLGIEMIDARRRVCVTQLALMSRGGLAGSARSRSRFVIVSDGHVVLHVCLSRQRCRVSFLSMLLLCRHSVNCSIFRCMYIYTYISNMFFFTLTFNIYCVFPYIKIYIYFPLSSDFIWYTFIPSSTKVHLDTPNVPELINKRC